MRSAVLLRSPVRRAQSDLSPPSRLQDLPGLSALSDLSGLVAPADLVGLRDLLRDLRGPADPPGQGNQAGQADLADRPVGSSRVGRVREDDAPYRSSVRARRSSSPRTGNHTRTYPFDELGFPCYLSPFHC